MSLTDTSIQQEYRQERSIPCYHCGSACPGEKWRREDKVFCCEGCELVYEILASRGMCNYYAIQDHPGIKQIKPLRKEKYAWLDDPAMAHPVYSFTNGKQAIVNLFIPGVHCTSCMWLLEHLHVLDRGIQGSRLNYSTRELNVRFNLDGISLRKLVELLCTLGYEPLIQSGESDEQKGNSGMRGSQEQGGNRPLLYKLGIAGFCFGNIMMLSFPEYLSLDVLAEAAYAQWFRWLSLLLSLPVILYSASEFYMTAWNGLKNKMLNIDAPIVLALVITFSRSVYEIVSGTGSGYLDSMSGVVFFMLAGRMVQQRSYRSLKFHRDYKAYFPIAVEVLTESGVQNKHLRDLKKGDQVLVYHGDIIPADAILLEGRGSIDYSFVTGESAAVGVTVGEQVYAGGRQLGEQIRIGILKAVASSYLTSLWNHHSFSKNKPAEQEQHSRIHWLSRYFTYILLSLAFLTACYWAFADASKIIPAVSAMLIVACPCALLLSATFTNANLLRIFSNNGLFLRDASVIEALGSINHIVFDKTGTLTSSTQQEKSTVLKMSEEEKDLLYAVVCGSRHPHSQYIASCLGSRLKLPCSSWTEKSGYGIDAVVKGRRVRVGSAMHTAVVPGCTKLVVYVRMDDKVWEFPLRSELREAVPGMIASLKPDFRLSLLSGDHNTEEKLFAALLGTESRLLFDRKPGDKLHYIENLQQRGQKVLMLGDGLNDAGALQQSDVGITLADDINNFTPSCDAILDATQLPRFHSLLKLARYSTRIINTSFVISILYNVAGLYFAIQGTLSPMIAAILMPMSTLSIVLVTLGLGSIWARSLGLQLHEKKV